MDAIDPRVHIDHVVLRVSDVPRAVEFYGQLLGLEPLREGSDGASLAAPGGDHPLVVLRPSTMPGRAPQEATGLFHVALRWPTLGGLGEVFARLVRDAYPLSGASDHGVSEALYLDDPDGNGIELYHDRPRETWPAGGARGARRDGHAARSTSTRSSTPRTGATRRAWTSGTCTCRSPTCPPRCGSGWTRSGSTSCSTSAARRRSSAPGATTITSG